MIKAYSELIKFGIVIFVLLAGLAGYATSFAIEDSFHPFHLLSLVFGLFFLSGGSLALNQVQEWPRDKKMKRTSHRPVPSGRISPKAAFFISIAHIFLGTILLIKCSVMAGLVGLATVLLYNVCYVYIWKKRWVFGAVPGAIPGALPVTIGYVANDPAFWNRDSIFLFLIIFLWQIPHFWVLALKYKEDYAKGEFPVLPVVLGDHKTLNQIISYTLLYVAVALSAPWFVHAKIAYLALVLPFVFFILRFLVRYIKSKGEKWLGFFLSLNFSMIVFLFVPVIDKWSFLFNS